MRRIVNRGAAAALVLAAVLARAAAAESDPPAPASPATPPAALLARGPLALTLAAQPGSFRGALETCLPLRRAASASARGFRLDVLALGSAASGAAAARASGAAVALEHDAPGRAAWLGVAAGEPAADRGAGAKLRVAAGAVRALTGLRAGFSLVLTPVIFHGDPRWARTVRWRYSGSDTSVWRDTSRTEPGDHAALWTTPQASLAWRRNRVALETVVGLSLGDGAGARRWAQALLRVQLSRRALLLAALGERPQPSLAFDGAAQPHTMIGVQFAPWSTPEWSLAHPPRPGIRRWRVEPAGGGRVVFRVQCHDTQTLEIAGDFTDWQPVALLPLPGGRWAGALAVPAGVHRVQVRLDGGAWASPPGLLVADDGPGGASGILIVH